MLLTKENIDKIKYKTKAVPLAKANAEINVALLPASLLSESRERRKEAENKLEKIKNDKPETTLEDVLNDMPDNEELGFKIIKFGVVDDKGESVFETQESFNELPLAIQSEIQEAIFDYNGLSEKSQGELEKN